MTNNRHRRQFLLGFLGFLGFLGIRYFTTHELSDLFWFSWLAFFGYFPVAKGTRETPDERYWENAAKARNVAFFIPLLALFIIGFSGGFPFGTREFMVIASALGWAGTLLAYSGALYYYETR